MVLMVHWKITYGPYIDTNKRSESGIRKSMDSRRR